MVKKVYIQLRADEADKERAQVLADIYGVSVSELVLLALNYIDENRPPLSMTIRPSVKVRGKRGDQ